MFDSSLKGEFLCFAIIGQSSNFPKSVLVIPAMGASHSQSTNSKYAKNNSTNGKFQTQQNYIREVPQLKGILKNKDLVKNETINRENSAKVVEIYVQRGNEWTRTRVREVRRKMLFGELTESSLRALISKKAFF